MNALLLRFSILVITLISCKDDIRSKIITSKVPDHQSQIISSPQIASYIRHIYEDKNGHFWFGTNGLGVAHYDGDSVIYYSINEGFGGEQITGISEDKDKNIWFATDRGAVLFDWNENSNGQKIFKNYKDSLFFNGERLWSIYVDLEDVVWAGGVNGVFRFNGLTWLPFELPYLEAKESNFISSKTTWGITQDKKGNHWFSTNGYGVYRYDGKAFQRYTTEDGLSDNHIDCILQDKDDNIWIGTRYGGISKFDGRQFTSYTSEDSIGNDEVCEVFEDRDGHIWFSSEGYGVYRFDGEKLVNYGIDEGLMVKAVQCIFQDSKGRIWAGGGGGLYRLSGNRFINITKAGPWG